MSRVKEEPPEDFVLVLPPDNDDSSEPEPEEEDDEDEDKPLVDVKGEPAEGQTREQSQVLDENETPQQMNSSTEDSPAPQEEAAGQHQAKAQEEPQMEHFLVLKPKWVKSVKLRKFDSESRGASRMYQTFLTSKKLQSDVSDFNKENHLSRFKSSLAKVKEEPPGEFVMVLLSPDDDSSAPAEEEEEDEDIDPNCTQFNNVKEEPEIDVLTLPPNISVSHKGEKLASNQSARHRRKQLKDGTFCCDKCVKSFSNPSSLKTHQREVHDERQVRCEVCGKICKNKHSLRQHRRIHLKVECSICKRKVTKCIMSKHLQTHSAERDFECDLCEFSATMKKYLKKHIERKHLLRKLVNDSKRDGFAYFELLEELQLKHGSSKTSAELKFKCDKCEKSFALNYTLKTHKRQVHTERLIKCPSCTKAFKTKGELTQHTTRVHGCEDEKLDDTFDCDNCGKSFSNPLSLKTHQREVHVEEPVKCEVCGKICKNRHSLQYHRRIHLKVECSICHKVLNKHKMRRHLRLHSDEKPFECDLCDYSVTWKYLLKGHIDRIHPPASDRPGEVFKCDECPHQTKYKSYLAAHKATHNKLNCCETCQKKFSVKNNLKLHQMQHKHGIYATKPAETFDCNKCDKSFSSPHYLKDHQRKIHDEKKVKCEVCDKILKNRDSLHEHLQTHDKHECSICHKMITKYKMALHKRMHSAENVFQCHLCNYSGKRKGGLVHHIERAHLLKQLAADSTKDGFDDFEMLEKLRSKFGIVSPLTENKLKCEFCEKSFAYLKLLKQHKRVMHSK